MARKDFIFRQADAILSKRLRPKILRAFKEYKTDHIHEFLADDISTEIAAGPNATSKYFNRGNLFSFFGFKPGDNPIEDLKNFLIHHIRIKIPPRFHMLQIRNYISYPEESDFNKARKFDLKWEAGSGGSWPIRVEHGMPNISKFAPKKDKDIGRSTGGIQLKGNLKSSVGDWGGEAYITKYHKKFFKDIGKIKV